MEVDAVGEAGLVYELLAGSAGGTFADQTCFDLAVVAACVDEGVHHLTDALPSLHHAERLIREAGLGRWQRDAAEDHLRAWWRAGLAQLLGQELGDADAAAAMDFRGEGFGDAPVTGGGRNAW